MSKIYIPLLATLFVAGVAAGCTSKKESELEKTVVAEHEVIVQPQTPQVQDENLFVEGAPANFNPTPEVDLTPELPRIDDPPEPINSEPQNVVGRIGAYSTNSEDCENRPQYDVVVGGGLEIAVCSNLEIEEFDPVINKHQYSFVLVPRIKEGTGKQQKLQSIRSQGKRGSDYIPAYDLKSITEIFDYPDQIEFVGTVKRYSSGAIDVTQGKSSLSLSPSGRQAVCAGNGARYDVHSPTLDRTLIVCSTDGPDYPGLPGEGVHVVAEKTGEVDVVGRPVYKATTLELVKK